MAGITWERMGEMQKGESIMVNFRNLGKGVTLGILLISILCTAGFAGTLSATGTLHVRARIDGLSRLVIQGDALYWHHLVHVAPGRGGGQDNPTYINGEEWFPEWPEAGENRDCNCDSSVYNFSPGLPLENLEVTLIPILSRGTVQILQQPSYLNDFSLVVEFDDRSGSGADWFEVLMTWERVSVNLRGLRIQSYIDGLTHLIVRENSLHWHHIGQAAPCRLNGQNLPTTINGEEWFPEWPEAGENRHCNCDSSIFTLSSGLPREDREVRLDLIEARDSVRILEYPSRENNYGLIVEFDDYEAGAEWYDVVLLWPVRLQTLFLLDAYGNVSIKSEEQ